MTNFESVCVTVADGHRLITVEDAVNALQQKRGTIQEDEAPSNIIMRWEELTHQLVGREYELNDGVRLNICPFCEAGVLRGKITAIKRGKECGTDTPPGTSSFTATSSTTIIPPSRRTRRR